MPNAYTETDMGSGLHCSCWLPLFENPALLREVELLGQGHKATWLGLSESTEHHGFERGSHPNCKWSLLGQFTSLNFWLKKWPREAVRVPGPAHHTGGQD